MLDTSLNKKEPTVGRNISIHSISSCWKPFKLIASLRFSSMLMVQSAALVGKFWHELVYYLSNAHLCHGQAFSAPFFMPRLSTLLKPSAMLKAKTGHSTSLNTLEILANQPFTTTGVRCLNSAVMPSFITSSMLNSTRPLFFNHLFSLP